jgi:protease II
MKILWSDLEWSMDSNAVLYIAKLSMLYNVEIDPKGSKLGIMLHRVGTDQKDDILIYQNLENPENYITAGMAGDKLICYEFNSQSSGMTLAYCELSSIVNTHYQKQDFSWKYINEDENISYSYIHHSEELLYLYFKDDSICPNGKIVSYSTKTSKLEDVIEESKEGALLETKYAFVNSTKIAVIRLFDLEEILDIYDTRTKTWQRVVDSQIGSYINISGSKNSDELFVSHALCSSIYSSIPDHFNYINSSK